MFETSRQGFRVMQQLRLGDTGLCDLTADVFAGVVAGE